MAGPVSELGQVTRQGPVDVIKARLAHCEAEQAEWDAAYEREEAKFNEALKPYHNHMSEVHRLRHALRVLENQQLVSDRE
jgi:hypothetical protein